MQIEYSIVSRGPEAGILPLRADLGIGMTAYGVLSRGLLSGSRPTGRGDFRAHLPRFTADNLARNARLVDTLTFLAREKGVSTVSFQSSARAHGPSSRTRSARCTCRSRGEDVARIERAVPPDAVAGSRYGEPQMRMLDSER